MDAAHYNTSHSHTSVNFRNFSIFFPSLVFYVPQILKENIFSEHCITKKN